MDQASNKYPELKSSLLNLSRELVIHLDNVWTRDWDRNPPKIGAHYNYWDIRGLSSFDTTISELEKIPSIIEKFSKFSLDKPIGEFLEQVVSSVPNSTLVDKAFEYWWIAFVDFILI